jgi:hypothetical protein
MNKLFIITTLLSFSGYLYSGDFTEYVFQGMGVEKVCGCNHGELSLCEDDRNFLGNGGENEQTIINQFQASCAAKEGPMTLKKCYCYQNPKTATRAPQSVDSIQEKSCTLNNAKLIKITKRGEQELARCR